MVYIIGGIFWLIIVGAYICFICKTEKEKEKVKDLKKMIKDLNQQQADKRDN